MSEAAMDASAPLAIRLLGTFRVSIHGRPVPDADWGQRRAAAIVKLLSLSPGLRLHREQLMESLWPDLDGEAAANNLRVALTRARRVLEANGAESGRFLRRDGAVYALGEQHDVWVDVAAFETAVQQAWMSDQPESARHAVEDYGGEFLPDDRYEEWAAGPRLALRTSYLALLGRLGRLHEERGELRHAMTAWQRVVDLDPLDEAAHAALIALFARVGETRQATMQFDRLATVLAQELGTEPDASTRALADAIRAGRFAAGEPRVSLPSPPTPMADAPLASVGALPLRLPVPPDELIGRERERDELRRLLGTLRLVTLTGPAGVGKTRLALTAAVDVAAALPAIAVWVDLAALRDPALVLPTIGQALGVVESGAAPLPAALVQRLAAAPHLLVLDNFEQILDAAPALADLLAACPALRVIVTSRSPLRIRGEQIYPVAPLALPRPAASGETPPDPEAWRHYPAVDLFVRRAQAARPDLVPTREEIIAMTNICRRLDGLPLAIELAAARARLLPLASLRLHIEQPLVILTDGARDIPDRQRSLRAAIAWSYDLLAAATQTMFARAATFSGSFTLEAAAAVAADVAHPGGGEVLAAIAELVDQALLHRLDDAEDGARFVMLQTVCDFAVDRLAASGAAEAAQHQHACWFLDLAERAEPQLVGAEAAVWLGRLERDHDNLRAAQDTFAQHGDAVRALRLAIALWRFWWLHGHLREGRARMARALADGRDAPAAQRARALDGAGSLASAQGDLQQAAAWHGAALELWRSLGDRGGMAAALTNLGLVADERGDPNQAEPLLREALDLARTAGDRRGVAVALANLGQVAITRQAHQAAIELLATSATVFTELGDQPSQAAILANLGYVAFLTGDYARAETCHEAALVSFRGLADRQGEADALLNLGHTVQQRGERERAGRLFEEALALFQTIGDRSGEAFACNHLGRLALLRGDAAAADGHLRAGFALGDEIGDRVAVVEAIEGLAAVACAQDDGARCARLLGAAFALREQIDVPAPPVHRPSLEACGVAARHMLGPDAFTARLDEGRAAAANPWPGITARGLLTLAG